MATRVTTPDFDAQVEAGMAEVRKHMSVTKEQQLATRTRATKRDASGGDSKDPVTMVDAPNPENTKPTRLGSGEEFGPEGQLTVKAAAELLRRGVEIAAAPVGEREGLIKATLANYGTLEAGSGEAGDRPRFDHHGTSKVFDAAYNEGDMNDMEPGEHLDQAHADLTEARGCDEEDEEGRYGHVMHACAHLSRYLSKTGGYEGDGDDDSILAENGEKVLKTFDETHTADLEAAAVSISKHTVQPGASHFGGFPKRK